MVIRKLLNEATPSLAWLKSGFEWRSELVAGLVGAVLVIPQGISFSYLVGVPIVHGLSCAIIITLLAAIFGNSITMSGPNTATSILLGLSVLPLVSSGNYDKVELVIVLSFLVGILQLLFWLSRAAKTLELLDEVAISGVTHGVGVLIIVSSLYSILSLESNPGPFLYKLNFIFNDSLGAWNSYAMIIGFATVVAGLLSSKKFPRYFIYYAILIGGLSCWLVEFFSPPETAIEYLSPVPAKFMAPGGFALGLQFSILLKLLPSALSITLISLAHNLVIAKDLKQNHDPQINLNKEVFAIGLANVVAPFFGSFSGAGSFNRTQVSRDMGARTPLTAIVSAVVAFLLIIFLGGFFTYIPDPLIGGLLFFVGLRMLSLKKMRSFFALKNDAIIFLVVLVSVLFWGLVPAVGIAVFLSLVKKLYLDPSK